MSRDQLQDVFPISFEFVEGEQASATKFTGWVKQTDTAFARISKAIGDPWEYQSHLAQLSPERLAQTSLARFGGPSDWLSPKGACWNEDSSPTSIYLAANRNTWSVGFPLVKRVSTLDTQPYMGAVTPLVWNTDIAATVDAGGLFTTEVSNVEDVESSGQFHINYYTGVITTFTSASSVVTLYLSGSVWSPMGPGVPWGTANVIPTWNQSTVCTVTEDGGSPSGGISTYTITLPTVDVGTRTSGILLGGVKPYGDGYYSNFSDVALSSATVGAGSSTSYRLPHSLVDGYSSGEAIPEGYMYLWDEATSRILPQVNFYYLDENSITVRTPEDWLTLGASVRILVPGTSISEAVHYLMTSTRDNRHVGLTGGQDTRSLTFTSPISHDSLSDRYAGSLPTSTVNIEKFRFKESDYPINPHPQYLHRFGWMSTDLSGNSGNAMRGHLVFTGSDTAMSVQSPSGCLTATYGVMFGGPTAGSNAAGFYFDGGENISSWTTGDGTADRIGFGLDDTGANYSSSTEVYGALVYKPYDGSPLYLKGRNVGGPLTDYQGAVLGFDLSNDNEMNYIKLLPGFRSGSGDFAHMPANTGQTLFTVELQETPALDYRLSEQQIREFRFRGVPYVSSATNPDDSLGGVNIRGSGNDIEEFERYYCE